MVKLWTFYVRFNAVNL